jgi:hypothetical protein
MRGTAGTGLQITQRAFISVAQFIADCFDYFQGDGVYQSTINPSRLAWMQLLFLIPETLSLELPCACKAFLSPPFNKQDIAQTAHMLACTILDSCLLLQPHKY